MTLNSLFDVFFDIKICDYSCGANQLNDEGDLAKAVEGNAGKLG